MNPIDRFTAMLLVLAFSVVGCNEKEKTSPPASSSSAASMASAKPLPPRKLETFQGMGITFRYPDPYRVESATSNPELHQVSVDHNKQPGVLTIRFNPQNPEENHKLDEIAEATRRRMDVNATVQPSTLSIAGKTYEARTIKSMQLGLVSMTDVVAIVPFEGVNFIVLTHVSDEDAQRAQGMFDTVLGSLAKQ